VSSGSIAWPKARALHATNATIMGDVSLVSVDAIGSIVFEHAQIGGNLKWSSLRFPRSLSLPLKILWRDRLRRICVDWSYDGRVRKATSSATVSNNTTFAASSPFAGLVLAHARISAALKAYNLEAHVPLLIDLSAASVYTIDDVGEQSKEGNQEARNPEEELRGPFPAGWGGNDIDAPTLDLDGFVYQRIEQNPPESNSPLSISDWLSRLKRLLLRLFMEIGRVTTRLLLPLRGTRIGRLGARFCAGLVRWAKSGENIAEPRLDWIRRQHKKRESDFYPQPYRHLAIVLRTQGHIEAAREVAIAEQDATPYGAWAQLWRKPFGFFFGYGLKPLNATITLLSTLLIGTFLVWLAWKQPFLSRDSSEKMSILVLTADQESAMATEQQLLSDGFNPNRNILERRLAENPLEPGGRRCGPRDIVPLFYALDMMLPVIQLDETNRCEVAVRRGNFKWQLAWSIFSVIGKIVTTLALITYSGVLKPKED